MSRNRKMYRYEVKEVHSGGEGHVEVGQVMVDYWHGKSHTYRVENGGVVKSFCTVVLIGPHEKSEKEIRKALEGATP